MPYFKPRRTAPKTLIDAPVGHIGAKAGLNLAGADLGKFTGRGEHDGGILNFEDCNLSGARLRASWCDIFLGGAVLTNATLELDHCKVYVDTLTKKDTVNDKSEKRWSNQWIKVETWPGRTPTAAIEVSRLRSEEDWWEQISGARVGLEILAWIAGATAAVLTVMLAVIGTGQ